MGFLKCIINWLLTVNVYFQNFNLLRVSSRKGARKTNLKQNKENEPFFPVSDMEIVKSKSTHLSLVDTELPRMQWKQCRESVSTLQRPFEHNRNIEARIQSLCCSPCLSRLVGLSQPEDGKLTQMNQNVRCSIRTTQDANEVTPDVSGIWLTSIATLL